MWQTEEMFCRFFFSSGERKGEKLLCHKNPNFRTQAKAIVLIIKHPNMSPIDSYIIIITVSQFIFFLLKLIMRELL